MRTWRKFSLFGLTLASDFTFANRLAPASGPPDLTFTCDQHASLFDQSPPGELIYSSTTRTEAGQSVFQIYRSETSDLLRFTDVADFHIKPEAIRCRLKNPDYLYLVEIHLLGNVLSYYLERSGILTLHASAVKMSGRAVAFLANNTGGKSSLAATFMQAGNPLLTDDILAIECTGNKIHARPGYPSMRMWPPAANHFVGQHEDLEIVHPNLKKRRVPVGGDDFGEFCEHPLPLACIFIPARRDPARWGTKIEIETMRPTDAMMKLIGHSFTAQLMETLGWQKRRLAVLAEMVERIPVKRLVYPNGYEYMPRVREAILNELEDKKIFSP
jgi:hypothetical protein